MNLHTATLLEGIPHPVAVLDHHFQICVMNRLMEAMVGYDQQSVVGIYGELIIRCNPKDTKRNLFKKVFESGESCSVTSDILNHHRQKIPCQYTVSPLKDNVGRVCGLLLVVEDISLQREEDRDVPQKENPPEIIGKSPQMQDVFKVISLMAETDASVMITGETGTGKDKIAEIIHKKSSRCRYPFIKINCGALPAGLLESELFGHVKGAFTGATRNKSGMFKLAHKGTIFLTEIGDMPLSLQVKLLSVLDDREFVPVGGEQKVSVDIRIIAATHRPLRQRMKDGEFREDLFYRLHVLHVHLPPLRERDGDLHYLIDHFLHTFSKNLGKSVQKITPKAFDILSSYDYPGNIRELRNIMEYAVNLCHTKNITANHLPPYLVDCLQHTGNNATFEVEKEQLCGASSRFSDVYSDTPLSRESWEDIERQMIIDALKQHSGNRTLSAKTLKWGRMKLWRKMKNYGLLE